MSGILDGFKDLEGIDTARDVHVREQTSLEQLIEIEAMLIYNETQGWYKDVSVKVGRFFGGYQFIYERLTELLKNVMFTENDLAEFVSAKANNDYQSDYSAALGLFTGCLLQILTERNAKEDKRTIVYINGGGKRFDYLFCHADAVDTLIVDNFRGDYICHRIGCLPEKKARNIVVMNTFGNNICAGANGHIWNLFVINCSGDYIASDVSKNAKQAGVSNLYIINPEGNYTAHNLADDGMIGNVFIVNENGNVNLGDFNVNADKTYNLDNIDNTDNTNNIHINALYIVSLGGTISFSVPSGSLVDIFNNLENHSLEPIKAKELYMYDSSVHVDKNALAQFQLKMQESAADEKISLLKSFKGKPYNQIMEILKLHF